MVQLELPPEPKRVAVATQMACAGLVVMVLTAFISVQALAGRSGPGGPRLNYDDMPTIEDYKPLPRDRQENSLSPRVPWVGDRQKPEPPPRAQAPQSTQPRSAPKVVPKKAHPPRAKIDVAPPNAEAQRKQILTRLYGHLSKAKNKSQADRLAISIERLWLHSGSPTTDILMKRTDRAIETRRWTVALTFADAIVRLQPSFTEGWMRRALIHYQRRHPTRALRDLRRVLTLEPNHFLALDRIGALLESVGENKSALEAYRKLKRLHPQAPGLNKRIEELTRKVEGEQI